MRIPIPIVLLLVLAVAGGIWWSNTRHIDFMTPPSAAELDKIRQEIESSLPQSNQPEDAISAPHVEPPPESPPPPPVEPPKPKIDLGDLVTPPVLHNYGEITPLGSAHLIELAAALEEKGEFQRALLAWERVIDLTKPNETQAATAISTIKRLRPTLPDWNTKPEAAIAIELHAGTGKTMAKTLAPVLEHVARDIEKATAGIVKVKATVTPGKNTPAKGSAPIALWLSGPGKKTTSTEVMSFTSESPEDLRLEVMKTVFLLIRSHLDRATAYTPPAALTADEDPLSALQFRITRLCWSEFAAALNQPQKKSP